MNRWQTQTSFGTMEFVQLHSDEIQLTLCNYGAMIYDLKTKDDVGTWEQIVLQYADLEHYYNNPLYLNSIVGPVAGRIANATYLLNNQRFVMEPNHLGTESLHSGHECLAHVFWSIQTSQTQEAQVVQLQYVKPPGPSQFPGEQTFTVTYTVAHNTLTILYEATTTQDTLVNLTNHVYFNLSGNLKEDILSSELTIHAANFLALNDKFSPVSVQPVKNTFLDFSITKSFADHFKQAIDIPNFVGIDHPLLLDSSTSSIGYSHPVSKRVVRMTTSYPCVVVYTHNHPDGQSLTHLPIQKKHYGLCLETQFEPNGINVDGLHDAILQQGQKYNEQTVYTFSVHQRDF